MTFIPVLLVDAAVEPSPNVRLENVQSVAPPKPLADCSRPQIKGPAAQVDRTVSGDISALHRDRITARNETSPRQKGRR